MTCICGLWSGHPLLIERANGMLRNGARLAEGNRLTTSIHHRWILIIIYPDEAQCAQWPQ